MYANMYAITFPCCHLYMYIYKKSFFFLGKLCELKIRLLSSQFYEKYII